MRTLYLDASSYATPRDLHAALKSMLSLPDYYGMNADALNDCLSERTEPVRLWIADPGQGEVAAALKLVCAVAADNVNVGVHFAVLLDILDSGVEMYVIGEQNGCVLDLCKICS